jgi:hypothetical protein
MVCLVGHGIALWLWGRGVGGARPLGWAVDGQGLSARKQEPNLKEKLGSWHALMTGYATSQIALG